MSEYNNYVHEKYDSDYNGILHNYHDLYNLHVSSTNFNNNLRLGYLIDNKPNQTDLDWCSKNNLYEYIQIDFKKPYTFTPMSYTFFVRDSNRTDAFNPINWTVQGLIGSKWENISEVRNSPFSIISSKTFTIDNYVENLNSLRFVQISINSKGPYTVAPKVFCLVELEIFGIIRKGICYLSINWNCKYPLQFLSIISVFILL